jgi:hypothetical protein
LSQKKRHREEATTSLADVFEEEEEEENSAGESEPQEEAPRADSGDEEDEDENDENDRSAGNRAIASPAASPVAKKRKLLRRAAPASASARSLLPDLDIFGA